MQIFYALGGNILRDLFRVGLSLGSIQEKVGNSLTYGEIINKDGRFSLISDDKVSCLDGDICYIIEDNSDSVTLVSEHESELFKLSHEEALIGFK